MPGKPYSKAEKAAMAKKKPAEKKAAKKSMPKKGGY